MTRRHLALFAGVLLFCGAVISAPAPMAEAAAFKPAVKTMPHRSPLRIRLGDGILSLRIQLCDRCGAQLTLEINLRAFAPVPVNHHRSAA